MSEDGVEMLKANTYYKGAVRLQVWDGLAKDPDHTTPDVAHFMSYVSESLL